MADIHLITDFLEPKGFKRVNKANKIIFYNTGFLFACVVYVEITLFSKKLTM